MADDPTGPESTEPAPAPPEVELLRLDYCPDLTDPAAISEPIGLLGSCVLEDCWIVVLMLQHEPASGPLTPFTAEVLQRGISRAILDIVAHTRFWAKASTSPQMALRSIKKMMECNTFHVGAVIRTGQAPVSTSEAFAASTLQDWMALFETALPPHLSVMACERHNGQLTLLGSIRKHLDPRPYHVH